MATATTIAPDEKFHLPEHAFLTRPSGDDAIDADLKYLRELPWSESSIGSIQTWPRELLVLMNLAMLSPQPQLFLLGPDSILIYNTAYGRLLLDHHPLYQGRPISSNEALIQNATAISRIVDKATTRAKPANENHIPFFFSDHGRLVETFLSATMVRLPDPLQGFHATTYNTTQAVVQARRHASFELISDACVLAKDLSSFWDATLSSLADCHDDVAFAMLYCADVRLDYDSEADCDRSHVDPLKLTLNGTVGFSKTPPPESVDLSSEGAHIEAMRHAITSSEPVHISSKEGTLLEPWRVGSRSRCYGDDCSEAMILPTTTSGDQDVRALLIIGLAPRRPYDDEYAIWIRSLHRFFTNSVTGFLLSEDRAFEKALSVKRADRAREILQKELVMKKKEGTLQRVRLEEVIEAKRQQENFIDMTSHEIRNPLGAVIISADSIAQSLTEIQDMVKASAADPASIISTSLLLQRLADIAGSVETISSCSMHQKRITDDILSLSKLDSNLLEVCPSPFRIGDFLNQVLENYRAETDRAGVTFETEFDSSIKDHKIDWVLADPGRIMQVLVNLITNAIKFTKDETGEKSVTVRVGVSETRDMGLFDDMDMASAPAEKTSASKSNSKDAVFIWFSIKDTGCGMDAEGKTRMFARFSQVSPKTYNKYGGSGLGLFISKKLVELQGGDIGFTSDTDQGTTFAFSISAQRTVEQAARRRSSIKLSPMKKIPIRTKNIDTCPGAASKIQILLVEDNLVNQKVFSQQLKRHGFDVATANNGQQALDFIKTSQHWGVPLSEETVRPSIDVILMDIEMPIMDGLICTRMIREAQKAGEISSHIPIVAVTANARREQLQVAIDVGMDDAVSKPFRVDDLKLIIERLALQSV